MTDEMSHVGREVATMLDELEQSIHTHASNREKLLAVFDQVKERMAQFVRKGAAKELAASAVNNAKQKVTEVRRKVITGDKDKRVRDYMHEVPVVRRMDTISFTLGVTCLILTQYVFLMHPLKFPMYHLAIIVPLLGLRTYLYTQEKFFYFMLDFCYFVNVLSAIGMVYPEPWFLKLNFVFANGPLAWAILAWRNSLVFHSVDKITSVFIHAFPALLTYCWRWDFLDAATGKSFMCGNDACALDFNSALVLPLLGYLLWQLLYVWKTEVQDKSVLANDPQQQTSVRWLVRSRGGMTGVTRTVCRQLKIMAKDEEFDSETIKTKLIFMTTQFLFTLFTVLPCKLLFEYRLAHLCFLIFVFLSCVYNGACYYIEVFSERYTAKFVKKVEADTAACQESTAASGSAHTKSHYS